MNQFYDEEEAEPISRLIHHYIATLSLDATRMYLTGLSQGGIGTWNLASNPKYCNIFAAIAAVCGGLRPPFERNAKQLAGMPIWAFHGANDSILPVSMSDESECGQPSGDCGGNLRHLVVRIHFRQFRCLTKAWRFVLQCYAYRARRQRYASSQSLRSRLTRLWRVTSRGHAFQLCLCLLLMSVCVRARVRALCSQ
jgi:poly(3-hydroxybutyrate) depolymerase